MAAEPPRLRELLRSQRVWTLYALTADEAEFWQGEEDRRHVRLRYWRAGSGSGSGWARELLWP